MKNDLLVFALLCLYSLSFSQISFTEVAPDAGINHVHEIGDFQGGGGAVIFDYNQDGLEDIYMTSGTKRDHLYHNNGDGTYTEVGQQAGLGYTASVYTMGAVAGDIDNDGDRDLFVTTRGPSDNFGYNVPNLLYQNNGDGTFTDISSLAGITDTAYSTSASFGDINEDGYLDIFVGNFFPQVVSEIVDSTGKFKPAQSGITGSHNFLYINKQDGSFIEAANILGVQDSGCVWATQFTDFDNDANIDLYVANDFGPLIQPNSLFQNASPVGPLSDISVSSQTNIAINSMGIAAGDYDEDGDLDYYVTNAASNYLLTNLGGGHFQDQAAQVGTANTFIKGIPGQHYLTQACFAYTPYLHYTGVQTAHLLLYDQGAADSAWVIMEVDSAYTEVRDSLSNDTLFVFLPPNTRYENCELLTEASLDTLRIDFHVPLQNGDDTTFNQYFQKTIDWGTYFTDLDNDTDLDLYVINGALNPNRGDKLPLDTTASLSPAVPNFIETILDYPNHLYENQGDGSFSEIGEQTGTDNVYVARGGVAFDYEEDGDMDMLVVCQNYIEGFGGGKIARSLLYRNESPPQNWLRVKLEGTQHNRDGIGARIRVVLPDGRSLIREVAGSSSLMSQRSTTVHFGLAQYAVVDTVEITWMNGCKQYRTQVSPNQLIFIRESVLGQLPEDLALCDTNPLTLNAPMGYTNYQWFDGQTTPSISITPTQNTTLYLNLSDYSGCSFSDSIHILVNPPILGNLIDTIIACQHTPYYVSNPSGPFDYQWSTGDSTANITIIDSVAKYYYLSVSNEFGCSAYDSIWMEFLPYPSITPLPDSMAVCQQGDSIHIDLGASAYNYLWSNAHTSSMLDIPIQEETTLWVVASAPSHCDLTDSSHVSIHIPEEIQTPDSLLCPGQSTNLSLPDSLYQYVWSTMETSSSISVSPSLSQSYQVTITDSASCTAVKDIWVTVHLPQGGEIAGLEATYCVGDPDAVLSPPTLAGNFFGEGMSGNVFIPAQAEINEEHEIVFAFTDSLGCPDTLRSTTEVWGICPSNFFVAIGEGDIHTNFPHLTQMVEMANRYTLPLTIQLSAEWVDSLVLDASKRQALHNWIGQGHEVGLYHIDATSSSWDGYSNQTFAQSLPNYQGNLESLLEQTTDVLPLIFVYGRLRLPNPIPLG